MFAEAATPHPAHRTAALIEIITQANDFSRALCIAAAVFVAVLTAAAAQISIPLPFTPVPLTLQPTIVLLGGALLGSRLGMQAQILYLSAGIAGLPVFAASPLLPQGFARLLGPTGGYLLAYPVASFLVGVLAERGFDRRYLSSVLAMTGGLLVIFAGGVAWLALAWQPAGGFMAAARVGLLPFLWLDLAKISVAAALLPACWKLVGARASAQ
ncbi:MAG: biotin transporter BioY [Acidobacteria bacterium]|nr:biotin transporter BioY [Acidobacteriota bacterium]